MRLLANLHVFCLLFNILLLIGCPSTAYRDIKNSRIAYDLGCDYLNKNQGRAAFEQFMKAVEMDPEFADGHNALGLMYLGLGDLNRAEKHLKKAISLNPNLPDYYNNLGKVYTEMGRYKDAIENFKKALSFLVYSSPHFAHANLGWAYYKNGQLKEAFSELNTALQISPNFCLAYRMLGIIYSETGQPLDALKNFNKFKENCPESPEPYYFIANIKQKYNLSHISEIISDYNKSLEKGATFCPSIKALGNIYFQIKNYESALVNYENFINVCGDDGEVFINISELYSQKGDIGKAKVFLTSCIDKWKNTDISMECQRKLDLLK
ncbi:MAG: tetratricopeptide repeat protein [Deltaproteobacteria bacterium]|nr:tetratricopeptide repeat protein [Deltaproteobacteria bacterium]